ncbi:hypothetical protein [Streptomyces sp. NPDC023327]|uniref:hypothetical protein n=1 Tax=Streptomyces sp. NPDC023327 TaxID=3157088 RepID=UPI0033FB206A
MTSARRILAAVSLAAGAAALAAPAAHAAPAPLPGPGMISVQGTLDELQMSGIPEEHRAAVPTLEQQLGALNQLNQLRQVTDLVAPVTNLLPSVQ